jgi:hypothetical protein
VILAGGYFAVNRVAEGIAHQMDLGGKTTPTAA